MAPSVPGRARCGPRAGMRAPGAGRPGPRRCPVAAPSGTENEGARTGVGVGRCRWHFLLCMGFPFAVCDPKMTGRLQMTPA